jgi:hypothetical protein
MITTLITQAMHAQRQSRKRGALELAELFEFCSAIVALILLVAVETPVQHM